MIFLIKKVLILKILIYNLLDLSKNTTNENFNKNNNINLLYTILIIIQGRLNIEVKNNDEKNIKQEKN